MPRDNLEIASKLTLLVRPLAGYMALAVALGVLGFLAAISIPVLGVLALLEAAGLTGLLPLPVIIALLIACAVCRGFLRYGEQLANHFIAFRLLALIRSKVFKALRDLAPAKMETKEKGDLVTVVTADIELLEVFYAHTLSPIAIALVTSTIMVALISAINPSCGVIALLGYLSVGLVIPFFTARAGSETAQAFRDQSGRLSSYLLGSLQGISQVMQFGQGESRLVGIRARTADLSEKQAGLKAVEGLSQAATGATIMVFSLVMLACGIALVGEGSLGAWGAILAFTCMISSFGPVVALSGLANNLVHTFAAANRVLDILEEQPLTTDITQGEDVTFTSLACKGVSFGYGEEDVLDNFNMGILKNQTIGISGKSGSGKSTLLRLMMRFWDVDEGHIQISGTDLRNTNTTSLRRAEGFVTQETQLFNCSIEENVRIAKLDATREEVVAACKQAAIHDFICTLPKGYETPLGEAGDALSGGEKQRIGLARAFLHDAPLILLDEPTSNLDSLNEGIVLQSLRGQAGKKAVVLVSHRLSTLSIADEIITMQPQRSS